MALNFVVSYTFSPSTTISSSQVNTNTSDVANVFTGLEAKTKTFSNLQVDATPTVAADVAIKSYVDKLNAYRRPVLQYNSGTVVNIETGLDGTSGDCVIVFPDGTKRTDTATGRIQCNLAQVAALSGSWQSGLRTGAVANNTWYAIYAVKTTDDTAKFVAVADTVLPVQGSYATLNSNFGASGWVYLGMIPYGDNSGTINAILSFKQVGAITELNNVLVTNASKNTNGILLAGTAGATTLTWTYATGTAIPQIPAHISNLNHVSVVVNTATGNFYLVQNSATTLTYSLTYTSGGAAPFTIVVNMPWTNFAGGIKVQDNNPTSLAQTICLQGWVDGVLGIGPSPVL